MSKSTCCSICRCTNRRTVNIYGTNLQYVYETLANFKITDVECWVCYICHTRLQQCLQLQQLAVQTRGVPEILVYNKVKLGVYRSVLELSSSRTIIVSTTEPSLYIKQPKQESDVKKEVCSDNELEAEFEGNEVENKTNIKSENAPTEEVEITFEKVSQSEIDEHPTTSLEHGKIKQETAENIRDEDQINEDIDNTQDACEAEANKPHKCDVCSKRFPTKSLLVTHSRTHTGEKPLSCDVCSKKFSQKSQLIVHKRIHTGFRPYKCDICPKQFSYFNTYTRHKWAHTGHKPYSWKVCPIRRTIKSHFNAMNSHMGLKPFSCDVCSKSFSHKYYLKRHIHSHSDDKPHFCDICSKQYKQKLDLQRHLLTHLDHKGFSCEVCSKKFTERRYLESHRFVHTGIKRYTCDVCTKKFARKSELNKHTKRVHIVYTGPKPHCCNICTKSFLYKKELSQHVLVHTGEKPFSCDLCLKKFTRKSNLKVHRLTHTRDQHLL